jgi:hypothetical protein
MKVKNFLTSNLIEQFKTYPKESENVDLAGDDESLDDLPYYLGTISREETAKILIQIKQVNLNIREEINLEFFILF